jgi:NPCBM/NEW2 domain
MTDQPKVSCDGPLGNRNGSTAVGNHKRPGSPGKAALAERCATIGDQATQHAAARHRWVAALLILALSGALVGCSSGSHSPNASAAVKPASGPASTGSPAAPASTGSPAAPASPSSSGSPALVTYIEDLQPTADSEPYDTQGVAQINGVSYPHSQGAQFCFGSNERKWTYVLGRKYSFLQGTIGLSDNSVSTAKIEFDVLADGRLVYSKDLQVGQSTALNVSVTNVLQLGLNTTLLTQDGGCGAATGEWANIHVVGP